MQIACKSILNTCPKPFFLALSLWFAHAPLYSQVSDSLNLDSTSLISELPQTEPVVPKKINIAVLTLKNNEGVTNGEAQIISDRLRSDLFNTGRVIMLERDQMQEILYEKGFMQSGVCEDQNCMVKMGSILGVEQLVTGSIGKVGSVYILNLRIIDIQTGKFIRAISKDINGMDMVVSRLPEVCMDILSDKTMFPSPDRRASPSPVITQTALPEKADIPLSPVPFSPEISERTGHFGYAIGYRGFYGNTIWQYQGTEGKTTYNNKFGNVVSGFVSSPGLSLFYDNGGLFQISTGFNYIFWKQQFNRLMFTDLGFENKYSALALSGGANLYWQRNRVRLSGGPLISYHVLTAKEIATSNGSALGTDKQTVWSAIAPGGNLGVDYRVSEGFWLYGKGILQKADYKEKKDKGYTILPPMPGFEIGVTRHY